MSLLVLLACRAAENTVPDTELADSLAGALHDRGRDTALSRTPPDTSVSLPGPAPEPALSDCETVRPEVTEGTRIVQVYFSCHEELLPVTRRVPQTQAVLRASLEELLAGPTVRELRAGFHSFFSSATAGMLESVTVENGVARIAFRDFSRVIPNASTSAGSEQLLAQLRATIFQYPTVSEAWITFSDDCAAFWNWLQRDCQALLPERVAS